MRKTSFLSQCDFFQIFFIKRTEENILLNIVCTYNLFFIFVRLGS
jgi:hypothetical protein